MAAQSTELDVWAREPWLAQMSRVQELIDRRLAGNGHDILDAGCGSSLKFTLPADARRTGIDLSSLQLERNTILDVKIQGDVQEHDFPADSFDIVFCWDLLEHLPEPERALERFSRALRPGGLLVIGVPNLYSPKGVVTKLTPSGFHVWFYKRILRSRTAGSNDIGPFKTYLKHAASPPGLRRYAASAGLALEHIATYEGPLQRRVRARARLDGRPWQLLRRAVQALTLGRIDPAATDVVVVFRDQRPARQPAAV